MNGEVDEAKGFKYRVYEESEVFNLDAEWMGTSDILLCYQGLGVS